MFRPKKIIIPAKYGTIERKIQFMKKTAGQPDLYETSTELIVLRPAGEIEVGGLFRKKPLYKTRSERVYVKAHTFIDEVTGKEYVNDAYFKTVIKQVLVGYRTEYGIDLMGLRQFKNGLSFTRAEEATKSIAVSVLIFFLPTEYCESLIGDLLEECENKSEYLKKFTSLWLIKEVLFTLTNVFLDWFLKKIPIRFKIGN